jgi:hypothetical protein
VEEGPPELLGFNAGPGFHLSHRGLADALGEAVDRRREILVQTESKATSRIRWSRRKVSPAPASSGAGAARSDLASRGTDLVAAVRGRHHLPTPRPMHLCRQK